MVLEMKAAGMVVDSKSPWCSPVRTVRKKDGTVRLCIDYRKLNAVTIKDAYPVPVIEEIFPKLANAKIFSTIDLKNGYYQVKIEPSSCKYTAFATSFGFYEFKVLPMGLTNAVATFQRLMNKVLKEYIDKFCVVYLDDIIVYSANEQEHLEHLRIIAECLRQHNLKISMKKCKFFQKIEYLSHIIEDGMLKPNPAKIAALTEVRPPTNVKEIQSFLGFASYYRKFIKNFSKIASPMIRLTEKKTAFQKLVLVKMVHS